MTTRLAAELHTGDVFRLRDWSLHVTANATQVPEFEVIVEVAEFPFPLHLGWFQTVPVVDGE